MSSRFVVGLTKSCLPYRNIRGLTSGFKSILPETNLNSPFADPSRTGKIIASLNDLAATDTSDLREKQKSEIENLSERLNETVKIQQTEIINENSSEPVVAFAKVPEATVKETNLNVHSRLSAIEELTMLKDTIQKTSGSNAGSDDDDFHSAEAEKRRKRMEKNTRLGGIVMLGGSIVGLVSFCLYYGRSARDEQGNIIPDEFSGSVFAPFFRIINSFHLWRDYVVEPARDKLLPDPLPLPYHQPKYTVVLEMKNILVSPEWTYKSGYRFVKRPALDYFLDVIGYPNFEVVIYTSEGMMTAHPVVDSFDGKQRIMYRLYRDCTKYMNGHHVKDLSKLNRDLSKVIYIEYDPKSGQLNPENMLRVPEWKGNMDDTSLVDLAELLKTIHLSDVDDVRPLLQYYSAFDDPAKEFRKRAMYVAEQEASKASSGEDQSLLKRYSGRLFGYRRHAST